MNKNTFMVCLTILVAAWILRPNTTVAQEKNYSGVFPFVTAAGILGLFDQKDGKLYMYNNNLTQVVYMGQVTELGKPLVRLNTPQPATEVKSYGVPYAQ